MVKFQKSKPFWLFPASLFGVEEARNFEAELARIATVCAHEGSNLELVRTEIERRRADTGMRPSLAAASVFDDLVQARWMP